MTVADLRCLPDEKRGEEARRLATEDALRPFYLANGPLLRTSLLRLGEVEYVFVQTLHHIICDGWSTEIFFRELTALNTAFSVGAPSPLPELPIQYADFAVWQREWLQGATLQAQLAHWRQRLADLPLLHLPTDHPRRAVQRYRGSSTSFEVPSTVAAGLKVLSQREGVTLFMTLLAAFQALLTALYGPERHQ